ncbi:MAG: Rieske 2Fe-2S domain-containing protein, partial [Chloroflexota bacterium]|nr:Rieske 2Fe-2S domain-containing protein [Chloroflexota bacterium]
TDELKDGAMKSVKVEGREILLARVGDRYYAANNRCPHMGGNLSQGKLTGTVVTCPRHGSQFDLADGHVIRWTDWAGFQLTLAKLFKSPRPLPNYPVKLEGDSVKIEV